MGTNERGKITFSDDEVAQFLEEQRVATIATIGPNGMPHLVAMWFAVVDGDIWFETKAKSQKVVNLRRDPGSAASSKPGTPTTSSAASSSRAPPRSSTTPTRSGPWASSVWERYNGPYSEEVKPLVEFMLNKRVAVRIRAERTRTWDHRKLGMPPQALGGTTKAFLDPIT